MASQRGGGGVQRCGCRVMHVGWDGGALQLCERGIVVWAGFPGGVKWEGMQGEVWGGSAPRG